MPHLFTYGTLMFPEIWRAVLGDIIVGKDFETTPAHLTGFEIFRVAGALYPGIVKSSSQPSALSSQPSDSPLTSDLRPLTSVSGLLYHNLDPESLERLDAFEGDFYVRQTITVFCQDVTCVDGRELEAEAYIVPPESAHLLTNEPWTQQEFQARGHLAEFIAKYSGFERLD